MGIHVMLDIAPDQIDEEAWAEAYDTTLRLLTAHPSRLMGFDWTTVCGIELPVYTRSIERHPNKPGNRHWSVIGDRASLRTGECQTMYRDLRHYRQRGSRASTAPDILQHAAGENHGDSGGPIQVFGDKTQGEPYHLPVLAAAMVVESRFPLHAMACGDIDHGQAVAAQTFAESVLQTPVALPVCVDPPRLIERLRRFTDGDALVRSFDRLYAGDPDCRHEALFRAFSTAESERWYLAAARDCKDPSQMGAKRLFIAYLNSTNDLARLCELSCIDPRGPRYDAKAFVDALAGTWAGVRRESTAFLHVFSKPEGLAHTVASLFGGMLLDMEAAGRHLTARFEEGAIEKAFAQVFGEAAAPLVARMRRRTAKIEGQLAAPRQGMPAFVEQVNEEAADPPEDLALLPSPEDLSPRRRDDVHTFAFATLRLQREIVNRFTRAEEKGSTRASGSPLSALGAGNAPLARIAIAEILSGQGPTLSEDAWDWIAREEDLEVLHFLLTLAVVANRTLAFSHFQRAMFENAPLCRYAVQATKDEALMAEVAARMGIPK